MNQVDSFGKMVSYLSPEEQLEVKRFECNYKKHFGLMKDYFLLIGTFQFAKKQFFKQCIDGSTICMATEKYYYFCRQCCLKLDARICEKCFDFQYHKDHHYYLCASNDKPHCDCGFFHRIKPQATKNHCKNHIKQCKAQLPKLSEEQKIIFVEFFVILFKIMLNEECFQQMKNEQTLTNTIYFLLKINRRSLQYNQLTVQVFSSPFKTTQSQNQKMNEGITIFERIMSKFVKKLAYNQQLLQLCIILCAVEKFQYLLSRTLYIVHTNSSIKYAQFFLAVCDDFDVCNQLAKQDIFIYCKKFQTSSSFQTRKQIINFYSNMLKMCSDNKPGKLEEVWRCFLRNTIISLQAQKVSSSRNSEHSFFDILTDCTSNLQLFQQIIKVFIEKWHCYNPLGYFSSAKVYNKLSRICLRATNSDIEKLPIVFEKCDNTKLSNFINFYFIQMMSDNKKPKFNSLTAKCLLKVAKAYSFSLNRFHANLHGLTALRLARILSIVQRNLACFQYVQDLQIYQIAQLTGNGQLMQQKQAQVARWFKQYMFTNRIMTQVQISRFKSLGLFKLKAVKQLIKKQTIYIKSKKIFEYNGPEIEIKQDLLLIFIAEKVEIYGLQHDQKTQFHRQDREQILLSLFNPIIKSINLQHFFSYTKADRYLICATAVILDKMTNKKSAQIANYIQLLRNESIIYRAKNIDKLFKLRQYQQKQVQLQKKQIKYLTQCEMIEKEEQKMEKNPEELMNKDQQDQIKQQEQLQIDRIDRQQTLLKPMYQKLQVMAELQKKEQQIVIQTKIQKKIHQMKTQQQIAKLKLVESKRQKLKEKYMKKSNEHMKKSQHLVKQEEIEKGQQICLICKEAKNDYSLLYYYGAIRKSPACLIKSWFKQDVSSQYTVTTCNHTVHKACIKNLNRKCVLCQKQYNILLPVLAEYMNQQETTLALSLWRDQDYSQAYRQLIDYNCKTNSQNLTKCSFELFLRSLLDSLGVSTFVSFVSRERAEKKRKLLFKILVQYNKLLDIQFPKVKLQVLQKLQPKSQEKDNFYQKVQSIVWRVVTQRLGTGYLSKDEKEQERKNNLRLWVQKQVQQLLAFKLFKYGRKLLQNLQMLLDQDNFQGFRQLKNEYTLKEFHVLQYLNDMDIFSYEPVTLKEIRRKAEWCKKCNKVSPIYCLTCKKCICISCTNFNEHFRKNVFCVLVKTDSGVAMFKETDKYSITQRPLFVNQIMMNYEGEPETQQYSINKQSYSQIIIAVLSGFQ